jgi:hypothetical protein
MFTSCKSSQVKQSTDIMSRFEFMNSKKSFLMNKVPVHDK